MTIQPSATNVTENSIISKVNEVITSVNTTLDNYLPSGTIITVETDGSGDFTNLYDAFAYLSNKWSNGEVTISVGEGTFIHDTMMYVGTSDSIIRSIPSVVIAGAGASKTILQRTAMNAGEWFFDLFDCTIAFYDLKFVHTSGTSSTNYSGIRANRGCSLRVENLDFEGVSQVICAGWNGSAQVGNLNISKAGVGFNAICGGTLSSVWSPTLSFTNVTTAFSVSFGGRLNMASPNITYTNVTNKRNQDNGTITNNGWITGVPN